MYLVSTYYIMGTVVDARGIALDKPHMVSLFMDQGRGQTEKRSMTTKTFMDRTPSVRQALS